MNRNPSGDSTHHGPALPFLKWPGGKRWLAPTITKVVGRLEGTYFEPFLGGGAVFFHMCPKSAVLSDCNKRLIQIYKVIQHDVESVIDSMRGLRPSRRKFTEFRNQLPKTDLSSAVQFLYLNRTAFNGMYRVNRAGYFNVPYGCKKGTRVCDADLLRSSATALARAKLIHSDFEQMIDMAGNGDVVYCDPPFTVKHDNNGFIRYNEFLFSWEDQERLARACDRAAERGALVIVSNAHHNQVRDLYRIFIKRVVERNSLISGVVDRRGTALEYLFIRDGRGTREGS